jgi:DUF4097 and DUF4098 domain-containing protein YvlB
MMLQSRAAFLFALLLILPLSAPAQQIESTSDGFTATINKTFAVEPGGTLDLQARNGSITVTGGDRSEVLVEETIRFDDASRSGVDEFLQEHPTSYEVTNGTVRIRGPEGNGGWSWWGDAPDDVQYSYVVQVPRRFSTTLQTSGGSLSISNLEGEVQGKTAGGSVTTERITGNVQVQTAGGSLTLRQIEGRVQGETAGGSVEVDSATGPVNVRTAGGSIRVTGAGGNVSAETAGGSIRAESVEGTLDARTSGGDIVARRVTEAVKARTSGGDIELRELDSRVSAETSGGDIFGESLRGAVDVQTSAGDVELRAVSASVTANTSVGDVEVELTTTAFSTDMALQLSTSHGDIDVTLPSALSATIRAEVEGYGRVGSDEIRSDVPLTREGGDGEPLRATGEMNGGGPAIELETSGGSIHIRTSDA